MLSKKLASVELACPVTRNPALSTFNSLVPDQGFQSEFPILFFWHECWTVTLKKKKKTILVVVSSAALEVWLFSPDVTFQCSQIRTRRAYQPIMVISLSWRRLPTVCLQPSSQPISTSSPICQDHSFRLVSFWGGAVGEGVSVVRERWLR